MDKDFWKKIFDRDAEIIIFGAGERGRSAVALLNRLEIRCVAVIDNDERKQGGALDGIPIYPIGYLDEKPTDTMLLVSVSDSKELYGELSARYENVYPTETIDLLYRLSYLDCEYYGYDRIEEMGNFNSPFPDISYCIKSERDSRPVIRDIDFQMEKQKAIFESLLHIHAQLPAQLGPDVRPRFYEDNTTYGIADAFVLHGMIRLLQPSRIIEIGSGFSSAVMLDTNEYYCGHKMELTFIEPYPARLRRLLKESDHIHLEECGLQEVDLAIFEQLEAGDILFVDSSHLAKRGSDVNRIFFEILPALNPGVCIHFHDITADFEYPLEWLKNGWIWNESYLLRAFLMHNNAYEMLFFNDMWNEEMRRRNLFDHFVAGANIWIRKL